MKGKILKVMFFLLMACFALNLNVYSKKSKHERKNAVNKEEKLKQYYKKWLEQDVAYIITEEEKKVFLKLTTDEERDQFIEQFWKRRDPDPKTPFNEFKAEYYRRIAYANEHFTAGIPGWKTDRGRIYIKFGPPDHIEDYVYGAGYDRPYWEGWGKTKVFPTQIWEYRFIPGIGTDVELEFVDTGGGNLYRLTANPNDKDLLLHADTQGKTFAEQYEKAWRIDRVVNKHDAGDRMDPYLHERAKDKPFAKYELLANVNKAPEIKYKDLKAIVTTHIKYDLFPFRVRTDYVKISEDQVLVPVTLSVKNKDITFKDAKFGYTRGTLNLYGIVLTMSNRFVKEFEDDIKREVQKSELDKVLTQNSTYQHFLLLHSGIYKLQVVVKDVNSGKIGVLDLRLQVPSFKKQELQSSSLILSTNVRRINDPANDVGPFVLGDLKVVPDFRRVYHLHDPLWVYMQVYNMAIDQHRLEPDIEVEYIVQRDGKAFYKYQDLKGSTFHFVSGDRIIITGKLPLHHFGPGNYTLKVKVSDNITGRSIERSDHFKVIS